MKKIVAIFAALLTATSMMAQEKAAPAVETNEADAFSQWSVSLGVSYRKFHKVDFKHRSAGSFEDAVVVDDALLPATQENLKAAIVEKYGALVSGLYNINYASYSGYNFKNTERVDTKSCFAPALGAETNLWSDEDFTLKAAVGLQYFNTSADDRKSAKGKGELYSRHTAYNAIQDVVVPNTASKNAATIDDVSNVKASGRAKFSADLFVLDLGLKGGYSLCEDVSIFAAVGPTLTYARMDSSTYSTFSSNGVKLASSKCVDDKSKCRFGYYVSGGAQYDFCENWALSAELRWDDAFGKLETKVAEQRLDSLGGVLKVIYNF